MHVLTVLDHPHPASFAAAIAQAFMEGVATAGHTVELADLHAEGFDPRWTMADVTDAESPELIAERTRIARADAICLVFPLFWWGMPSMTKGWVDRVWSWGWAYDQLDDPNVSLQKNRSGLLLVPAGAKDHEIADAGYLSAMETTWMDGTLGYFGWSPRRLQLLCGSKGSSERREALLKKSFDLGVTLPPPTDEGAQLP